MKHCIQRSIVGISVPLYYGKKIEFYAKCNGESETRSFASSIRWEIFKVVMHTTKTSIYLNQLISVYLTANTVFDGTLQKCPNLWKFVM